jgi:hypothetical protein
MAYPTSPGAAGYSGTFIPEIWSSKLLVKWYDGSVVPQITNTAYEGEIRDQGDKVIIRTVPDLTIRTYAKGQELTYEQPESENVELLIDQGYYWAFRCDDVDKAQFDIEWMSKWSDDASEQLKIQIDTNVLAHMYPLVAAANKGATAGRKSASFNMGVSGTPVALTKTNILDYIAALGTILDEQNVPETGRWIVLPPHFMWMLKISDLKDASLSGDGTSILRNGRVGMIDRFTIYSSNLVPTVTDGSDTVYQIMAGTKDATTFATQVTKTETLRSQSTFGELVRGLMVFGRKVIKPEAIGLLYAKKG